MKEKRNFFTKTYITHTALVVQKSRRNGKMADCPICGNKLTLLEKFFWEIEYKYDKHLNTCRKCSEDYYKKKKQARKDCDKKQRNKSIRIIKKGCLLPRDVDC